MTGLLVCFVFEFAKHREVGRIVAPRQLGILSAAGIQTLHAASRGVVELHPIADTFRAVDREGEQGALVLPGPRGHVREADPVVRAHLLDDDDAGVVNRIAREHDVRTTCAPREALDLGECLLCPGHEVEDAEIVTDFAVGFPDLLLSVLRHADRVGQPSSIFGERGARPEGHHNN